MKVVNIKDLDQFENQEVELRGWVYNIRSIGKIWFVILRDGTGFLQGVVVKGEATDETFNMEQIPWYVRPILFPDSSAAGRNSLSEQMMTFWSNIAKYGNPNAFGKQKNCQVVICVFATVTGMTEA